MIHQTIRRLILAWVGGLTLCGGGCLKHAVTDSPDRARAKPAATRSSAEEDTFEILQGDWMRQHERPFTPQRPPGGG